jgi:flavin reductase (DIM6/NTAB) family NADH-FMN oxidoreductase RutF
MHNITPDQFKQALGSFASGVTIVTARRPDGGLHGVTVSSFASLSLTPRLITFAITRDGDSHAVLSATDRFAIHILATGQEPLSNHFARQGQVWDGIPYELDADGLPMLPDVVARLSCLKAAQIAPDAQPVGDHDLLIGEIVDVMVDPQRQPLLYFRGDYRSLVV